MNNFSWWPVSRLGKQTTHWYVQLVRGDTIAHTYIDFRDALDKQQLECQLQQAKRRLVEHVEKMRNCGLSR